MNIGEYEQYPSLIRNDPASIATTSNVSRQAAVTPCVRIVWQMFDRLDDFEVTAGNRRVVCVPGPLSDTAVGRDFVPLRRVTSAILLTCLSRLSIEVVIVLVEVDWCVRVSLGDWSITLERDL